MKKYNLFSTPFGKFFKLFSVFVLLACGPGMLDLNEFKSYFMPESANYAKGDERYHFSTQFFYVDEYADTLQDSDNENIRAWRDYIGEKLSEKEIRESVYKNGNKLAALFQKGNKIDALNYLQILKETESGDTTKQSQENTRILLEKCKTNYAKTTDQFLKERYAFLAIQLATILGDNQNSIKIYEEMTVPIKKKTFISDWALSDKAGREMALGDTAQSFYDFAQVFDRCASRRREADLSVRIHQAEKFYKPALKFCKNDHEKAAVYALAAIQPYQDGLPMLEKIVELEPKNTLAELIMAREINKNEFFFAGLDRKKDSDWSVSADSAIFHTQIQDSPSYFEKLKNFALKNAENKDLSNSPFWLTAAAYMEFINKDYEKSAQTLSKAKAMTSKNMALKNQIQIQEMLLAVNKSPQITPEIENEVLPYFEHFFAEIKMKDATEYEQNEEKIHAEDSFRKANTLVEACKVMAAKYRDTHVEAKTGWLSSCSRKNDASSVPNARAKAFLFTMLTSYQINGGEYGGFVSQTDQFAIEDTTSSATIQQVIAYFGQQNPSDFDKKLIKLTGFDNNYLYLVLGRRSLNEHDFAKAAEAFAHVSEKVWQKEPFKTYLDVNPFYLEPDKSENEKIKYTPLSFAKRMVELQKNAKTDAKSAFLLACGTYNMGYYGNSWILSKRSWSTYEPNMKSDYYNCQTAQKYFEQAMKSTDKELAAKACFMAAKCEQNNFTTYSSGLTQGANEDYESFQKRLNALEKSKFYKFFGILQSQYTNTNFEKEAIDECSYYKDYLGAK